MLHPETWALMPVKRFSLAKSRLCELLFEEERANLAQTMMRDVLHNLRTTGALDGIAVVSADPEALAIATSFGAATIFDPVEAGINQAVECGLAALRSKGCRVLVVPADIPFARPGDFGNVIELLDISPVVLVPALYDGGTNALAMRSSDLLQPQFGQESLRAHRNLARQLKLGCSVLKSNGIGNDIDSPLDLAPYLTSSEDLGLTGSFLEKLNIAERFGIDDAPAPLRLPS